MPFVGAEPITVIQRAPGTRDRLGTYTPGEETIIEGVLATVNPVPGRVLETLPEGEREGDQRRVITKFELRSPNEDTGYPGDHILYEGDRFEVRDVQVYRQVIPHLEVRVRRLSTPPAPLHFEVEEEE
jgi:hypothetical protein